jgi:hypothetical protein
MVFDFMADLFQIISSLWSPVEILHRSKMYEFLTAERNSLFHPTATAWPGEVKRLSSTYRSRTIEIHFEPTGGLAVLVIVHSIIIHS